jgi:aminoglycoside phosphotransferase family enzyme/predicted kinase
MATGISSLGQQGGQEEDQQEVIAFLSSPESHGLAPGDQVSCIQTHGAFVFLAGQFAYKLKRAVRLPYLDFSTLDKRQAVCRHEVELNRRTAPKLYLGVEAVVRRPDGRLAIGGRGGDEGDTVDWLVKMRRFPDGALLSRAVADGPLSQQILNALADTIAEFHRTAEVSNAWGGADELRRIAAVDQAVIARFTPGLFAPKQAAAVAALTVETIETQRTLLEERRYRGFVRHGHGDLHLANIYLAKSFPDSDRPTMFDAIEFDDRLAQNDTLYDLAFLLMDLWHRGLLGEANRVFNRYLLRSEDMGGLPALPLFLSMRARIRTQVTALTAAARNDDPDLRAEAVRYLDLAAAALKPPPPVLLAVGGYSGSGKSHLAAALAPSLGAMPGAVHLRSDELRKVMLGSDPETPLGQDAYTSKISAKVYDTLRHRAGLALSAGQAVIADAVHNRPDSRAALAELAARLEVPFVGIWLDADTNLMADRIAGRRGDASDADRSVMQRQVRHGAGTIEWRRLDAAAPLAEKVAQVQAWVGAIV